MGDFPRDLAREGLTLLLAEEQGKGAAEGLAAELVAALLDELNSSSELRGLPALKQAMLDYAIERAEEARAT